MHSLTLIGYGIVFGLGAAVPIGPVNVEIARRALTRGFGAALAFGFGAVTVDTTYVVLAALGLAPLLNRPWLDLPLAICGTVLLIYLGTMSLLAARKASKEAFPGGATSGGAIRIDLPEISPAKGYLTGVLMTAMSPLTIAFWFTVLPTFAGTITQRPEHDLPMICTGVFIGTTGWVVFFAGLMSVAGRYRKPWWLVVADVFGGITLLAFAGVSIWRSIARYL